MYQAVRKSIAGVCAFASVSLVSVGHASAADDIGMLSALSGPYSFNGVVISNGMKLALDEANASNSGAKINVSESDTAVDKAQAIVQAGKFAGMQNIIMMLGPLSSQEAIAVAPIINKAKLPMFTTAALPAILTSGPYAFKITPNGGEFMSALSDYAVNKLKVKKVSLVYDRSADGFIDQMKGFKSGLTKAGVTIVSEDGVLASDTNFVALTTKLAGLDVDALFVALPTEVSANFFLQARRAGVPTKVRFMSVPSSVADAFIATAGSAAEGTLMVADYVPSDPSPANQAFIKAYAAKYGKAPTNWAAVGYTMGKLTAKAVTDAGPNPTREKVRDTLANFKDVPVLIGQGTWGVSPDRNPIYQGLVVTVKDGKFVPAD